MDIRIDIIDDRSIWDHFIEELQPHSFLHTWQWGDFQRKLGHTIYRLGIVADGRLVGISLIILINARRGRFLFCPHGPLYKEKSEAQFAALIEYLKQLAQKEQASFIRLSPLALDTQSERDTFKALGFRPAPIHMHVELAWMLDITKPNDTLLAEMRKTTRYSIRRAEQMGATTSVSKESRDLSLFYDVYQTTTHRQHFTPFSLDYLREEFEAFARDNKAMLIFGSYQNEIVSAAYIIFSDGAAFYHHGASTHKFPNVPVSHLVQWRAIQEAKVRGMRLYNFWGIAPEGSGEKHPWAGLTLFKKGFGGFSEQYLHAQDLKLTSRYWLNYVVERVRKSKRRL